LISEALEKNADKAYIGLPPGTELYKETKTGSLAKHDIILYKLIL